VDLRVGIALDSGQIVATAYGPLGHAVNRCGVLCNMARGGQTLISEATRGLLAERDLEGLELVDLGEQPLGASGTTIRVYELILAGAPNG
jgi:class 3 adenylate cyclase